MEGLVLKESLELPTVPGLPGEGVDAFHKLPLETIGDRRIEDVLYKQETLVSIAVYLLCCQSGHIRFLFLGGGISTAPCTAPRSGTVHVVAVDGEVVVGNEVLQRVVVGGAGAKVSDPGLAKVRLLLAG
jgi:hypothetical protein